MTLVNLCSGVFDYVCELNRAAAVNRVPAPEVIKDRFKKLLTAAADAVEKEGNVALARQWKKIELPLVFFIDGMVRMLNPKAGRVSWTTLASEYGNEAGDDEFFYPRDPQTQGQERGRPLVYLDIILSTPDADSKELLKVYYVCLGLGYRGKYFDQPEEVKKRLDRISSQLRDDQEFMDRRDEERLCRRKVNDAYFVDKSELPRPTNTSIARWIALFLALMVVIAGVYATVYVGTTSSLTEALKRINAQEPQ